MKHGNPATSFSLFQPFYGRYSTKTILCWISPRRFSLNTSLKILVEYLPEDFCWISPWRFLLKSPWRFLSNTSRKIGWKRPWRFLLNTSLKTLLNISLKTVEKGRNIQEFPHVYILFYLIIVQMLKYQYIWWIALLHGMWVTLNLIRIFYNQLLVLVTDIAREHNTPEPPRYVYIS